MTGPAPTSAQRLLRAASLVGLGWCWARFGLDWVAGTAAIAGFVSPFVLAAREIWRRRDEAGRC